MVSGTGESAIHRATLIMLKNSRLVSSSKIELQDAHKNMKAIPIRALHNQLTSVANSVKEAKKLTLALISRASTQQATESTGRRLGYGSVIQIYNNRNAKHTNTREVAIQDA
jgi:hypothetical protein